MQKFAPSFGAKSTLRVFRVFRGHQFVPLFGIKAHPSHPCDAWSFLAPGFGTKEKPLGYLCYLLLKVPTQPWNQGKARSFDRMNRMKVRAAGPGIKAHPCPSCHPWSFRPAVLESTQSSLLASD